MTCNELSPRGYPAVKDAYSKSSAETTMKCTKILYIFMHVYIYIFMHVAGKKKSFYCR